MCATIRTIVICAALVLLFATIPSAASANHIITVDTTSDSTACDGTPNACSLRGAISVAKVTANGPHTVRLTGQSYTLTLAGTDNTNAAGDLDIDFEVIIEGNTPGTTFVQAAATPETANGRVFHVLNGGILRINRLTVRHGNEVSLPGGGLNVESGGSAILDDVEIVSNTADRGGGIRNAGSVTLRRSLVAGNTATDSVGGGGIHNLNSGSNLTVLNSTVSGNQATSFGGIAQVDGTTVLNNATVAFNTATSPTAVSVGLTRNSGTLTISNSIVSNNSAVGTLLNCGGSITSGGYNITDGTGCNFTGTGDLQNQNPNLAPLLPHAGFTRLHALPTGSPAIDTANPGPTGTLCESDDQRSVTRPTDGDAVAGARCDMGAYEADNRAFTVDRFDDDATATACTSGGSSDCSLRGAIIAANNVFGGPHVVTVPAGTYTLTIGGAVDFEALRGDLNTRNSVTILGAGADTTIIQAGPSVGAGIDGVFSVAAGVTFAASDVTIQHGTTANQGGAIFSGSFSDLILDRVNITGNRASSYGGIAAGGNLRIVRSTVSGNTATGFDGGGVGLVGSNGDMLLENVTISGNTASRDGSGLFHAASRSTVLNNVTIANNVISTPPSGNGVSVLGGTGVVSVRNSIFSNNLSGTTVRNCSASGVASLGNNIEDGSLCGFTASGDVTNTNPQILPLGNNGGTTQTHALQSTSPAIDGGNAGTPGSGGNACAAVDQRGTARPIDGDASIGARCDMGAYEAPDPPCLPRPAVSLSVVPGVSGLNVTVTAGYENISQILFRGAGTVQIPSTNVIVTINSQDLPAGDQVYTPSSPTTSVAFSLRRAVTSGAGTIPLEVTDGCGVWSTFVGGGANAWPAGSAPTGPSQLVVPPTPTATPIASPTAVPVAGAACATFPSHAAAQAYLRANPRDPLLIDRSRNGIACEGADGAGFVNPPLDHVPVPRP